uniref:Uncharacterized protein n=1 Tax=Glossina austeni TaxID=7395 RepID=A0A1A9VSF6_GLOAU
MYADASVILQASLSSLPLRLARYCAASNHNSLTISAPFSAIITTGAWMLPLVIVGIILASITLKPATASRPTLEVKGPSSVTAYLKAVLMLTKRFITIDMG